MSASRSKQTQSQSTVNTVTDTSANAGGDDSLAIGAGGTLNTGLSVGAGANVTVQSTDPETIATAFNFGTKALEAVSANTDRQVSGAVDAARQATQAAARLASTPAENSSPAPTVFSLATLKKHALPIAGGLAVIGLLLTLILRRKK